MVLLVLGISWMAVALVTGIFLGRCIAAADDRELLQVERSPWPHLERPLYVADVLAAQRPSAAPN
jgi:hypothetical protein